MGALLALVALAYWPALLGGFVWDDNKFIVEEAAVRGWTGLWDIWFNPGLLKESHYWPLLYTAFWLEHKLWGFNPLGFHAVNLLLHGAVSALLWRLLLRMAVPGAWFIAAIFALHPVHVEAVAWIIARKDLLASLFYLLAFGAWLNFRDLPPGARARTRAYLALLALYAAALLSKTVAITLPAALLVWAWWRQGAIRAQDLAQTAPLFLLGLALGAYGLGLYAAGGVIEVNPSLAERFVIAAKSLWFYAGKLLWPEPLLFIYPHWDTDPARLTNWLPLAGALALAAALWLARRRIGRGALAGALFFAITLFPTLGFAPFRYMAFAYAADRYQYLAMAGLVAALAGGAALGYRWLLAKGSAPRWVQASAGALAAALLLSYGVQSWERTQLFQDQVALFRHVIATNPDVPEAGHILGTFLMERGEWQAAEAAYRAALAKEAAAIKIHANLGSVLMRLERHAEAVDIFQQAVAQEEALLAARQDKATAAHEAAAVRVNLGLALLKLDRLAEAEESLRRALAIKPGSLEARQNLALALNYQAAARFEAGDYPEAERLFRESLALLPDDAETHTNLGAALGQMGRYREARASFEKALALNPQHKAARAYLTQLRRHAAEPAPVDRQEPDG